MKRFMMVLVALVMALVMAAGALAEELEIAPGTGVDAAVPEVEVELGAPEGEAAVSNDGEPTVPNDEGELKIPVDAAHFPDDVFRDYVSQKIDTNKDGWLDEDEMDEVEKIELKKTGVTSLQGVEYFYCLVYLDCSFNRNLKTIDLSKNENLEYLDCSYCGLVSLDMSGHEGLERLISRDNPMISLNLDGCESLLELANDYKISSTVENLSIKDCMSIGVIDCAYTAVRSLDVSDCADLILLNVSGCSNLTSLNLKDADELLYLDAWHAGITELDLSDCVDLSGLNVVGCNIRSIDITECERLVKVVKKYGPVCEGARTHFGEGDISYPIDITSTTSVVADGEVVYEPKFSLDKTGTQSIEVDKKVQLNAVYSPAELKLYGDGKVTWESSNKAVATVSNKGVVKGVKKGTTTITATSAWGATASLRVFVTPKLPKKVKLNKKGVVKLEKGKKLKLTATFKPKDAESKLTWTTSDADVATVSQKGKVKAVGYGTATITVTTENGKSAKVKIKVPKPKKKK